MFVPRSADYNLVEAADIKRLLADTQPDLMIHLAAVVGGIGANQKNPGKFFYENLMMGVQLIEQARLHGVKKFVALGTVCAYPKVHTHSFSRRRSLERLSRRNQRALWTGQEDDAGAVAELPAAVWFQLHLSLAGKPLWSR